MVFRSMEFTNVPWNIEFRHIGCRKRLYRTWRYSRFKYDYLQFIIWTPSETEVGHRSCGILTSDIMKRYVLGVVAILTLITSCVGIDQPISLKLGRKEYFSQNRAPSYGSNTISKGNLKFSNENSFIIDFNDSFVSSKGKEVSIGVYSQIDEPLKLYHKYDVPWMDILKLQELRQNIMTVMNYACMSMVISR